MSGLFESSNTWQRRHKGAARSQSCNSSRTTKEPEVKDNITAQSDFLQRVFFLKHYSSNCSLKPPMVLIQCPDAGCYALPLLRTNAHILRLPFEL